MIIFCCKPILKINMIVLLKLFSSCRVTIYTPMRAIWELGVTSFLYPQILQFRTQLSEKSNVFHRIIYILGQEHVDLQPLRISEAWIYSSK